MAWVTCQDLSNICGLSLSIVRKRCYSTKMDPPRLSRVCVNKHGEFQVAIPPPSLKMFVSWVSVEAKTS